MSEGPKRLSDDPGTDDPGLAARLRSDLRIARDAPPRYDVEGGLTRLSAAIAAGPSGGGHPGGGSGGTTPGPGNLASPGAATTSGTLGGKAILVGLLALGALGGALLAGSATKAPSNASGAATTALPALTASSLPSMEEPAPEVPRSAEPVDTRSSPSIPAAGPRGAGSAAPVTSSTIKPEMDQLAEIRRASQPARALALAEEGHARFPRGVFWQEREARAIGALVSLGRSGEAKARARAFVEKHPESPMAEGLRKLSEAD